jgi:hypothetical protein
MDMEFCSSKSEAVPWLSLSGWVAGWLLISSPVTSSPATEAGGPITFASFLGANVTYPFGPKVSYIGLFRGTYTSAAELPDGFKPKSQLGYILGFRMENVDMFYGQLEHFTAIWYIL